MRGMLTGVTVDPTQTAWHARTHAAYGQQEKKKKKIFSGGIYFSHRKPEALSGDILMVPTCKCVPNPILGNHRIVSATMLPWEMSRNKHFYKEI